MYHGLRALTALALAAGLSAPLAHAQLKLSGQTTGYFDDLSEANTTVINAADHSSASFETGIPIPGSSQSSIMFQNTTFSNIGSGDMIQSGIFTIHNGMTEIGSGAPEARFHLGLQLTSPTSEAIVVDTFTFHIDHTPNLPGAVPDIFSVTFNQPDPVKINNTLVRFKVAVNPTDFQVPENSTVKKGDIMVSFSPVSFTPVPEPTTYALWGSALLLGLAAWRRRRNKQALVAAAG